MKIMTKIIVEIFQGNVIRVYSNQENVEYRIYDRDLPDNQISPIFQADEVCNKDFDRLKSVKEIIGYER